MTDYTRELTAGLALFGRLLAKEGRRDDLLRVLEEAVALGAEHEPEGPLSVSIHVSPSNPELVLLYEHWPGPAALREHQANFERIPAYAEMRARMNDLLAKPIEIVEAATPIACFTRTPTEKEKTQ